MNNLVVLVGISLMIFFRKNTGQSNNHNISKNNANELQLKEFRLKNLDR